MKSGFIPALSAAISFVAIAILFLQRHYQPDTCARVCVGDDLDVDVTVRWFTVSQVLRQGSPAIRSRRPGVTARDNRRCANQNREEHHCPRSFLPAAESSRTRQQESANRDSHKHQE